MATLAFFTLMGSCLIVLMVAMVNNFTVHHKQADAVDNAALLAAHELSQVTVDHSSFGQVGLCDLPADRFSPTGVRQGRVISLGSLYETLRIDSEIAKKLGQKSMLSMAEHDTSLAHKVETELAQRLRQAVEVDTAPTSVPQSTGSNSEQDNTVYRDVYRAISSDREAQAATSVELKIYLGRGTNPIFTREETRLVSTADFVRTDSGAAPYLVLVEAHYEGHAKGSSQPQRYVKRACALIGAPTVEAPPSAFIINFPQGIPPQFASAHDILFNKQWTSKGDWQQAVGSRVPGKGSLAPPLDPVMPSMQPGDAMAVGLYHWLRSAGSAIDPDLAVELIHSKWDLNSLSNTADRKDLDMTDSAEQTSTIVNSCLARDTGAREYSIMNQTGPSSVGQIALSRAFAVFDQSTQPNAGPAYPPTALPLFVDAQGKCNLAGRKGFNTALIKSFLYDIHDTNIAATTSLAMAKQFLNQSSNALSQTEQRIIIERQELASVTSRLARMTDEASKRRKPVSDSGAEADDPKRIMILAQDRTEALRAQIANDEQQRANLRDTHNRATQAIYNATKAASATYELCEHAFKSCRDGIYQIDTAHRAYLIGKKFVFVAHNEPLCENDFFAATQDAAANKNKSEDEEPKSPWFSRNMEIMAPVDAFIGNHAEDAKAEGKSLKALLQEKPVEQIFHQGMIVLDSRSITRTATTTPACHGYKQYAFSNIAIPSGQLLYYCQNAIESGDSPKVSWSMLLRDLVATRSNASDIGATGNPIPSEERSWCNESEHGPCPGLACELQLRCPLPVLNDFSEDTYLKEPGINTQVPQIPPVPADML
jgi:hypothetical protein